MEWRSLSSSTIERVAYESQAMTLSVEFKNGTVYQYFDVPEYVFNEFVSASSPGQYLALNIKKSFRFSRT